MIQTTMARYGKMLVYSIAVATFVLTVAPANARSFTSSCADAALTPELTEGPYYLDEELFRADVAEGQRGVPLTLKVAVVGKDCRPLQEAFVDIWHANATGFYSGFTGVRGTDTTTFMRGVVQTDATGVGTFFTVYPGWYPGRTPHIHIKVHVPNNPSPITGEQEEFDKSKEVHTGQLFFTDELSTKVYQLQPYASRHGTFTRLSSDFIYNAGGSATLVPTTQVSSASLATGLVGTITIKVEATSASPRPSPRPSPRRSPAPKPSPRRSPSPKPSPRRSPSPKPSPRRSPSPRPSPRRSPSPRPSPRRT